jgi:hypothetical protein
VGGVAVLRQARRATLDSCMAGDLRGKRMVGGKALVEEAEELFKGAEGTEQIAGQEFDRLTFKGGQKHDGFLFQVLSREMHTRRCTGKCAATRRVWRGATR